MQSGRLPCVNASFEIICGNIHDDAIIYLIVNIQQVTGKLNLLIMMTNFIIIESTKANEIRFKHEA